ncbi:hypothetical protein GW17_00039582 [Ensete ventricosum]|nr:hypothetical protein GW17_00039582 [Ensete ventricosum]
MRWDFVDSSLGDSPKGLGSLLGTHREITRRRLEDLLQVCRRLSDWQKLGLNLACGHYAFERRVYCRHLGFRAVDGG